MASNGKREVDPLLPVQDGSWRFQSVVRTASEVPQRKRNNGFVMLFLVMLFFILFLIFRVIPSHKTSQIYVAMRDPVTSALEVKPLVHNDQLHTGVAFGEYLHNPDLSQWSYLTLETAHEIADDDAYLDSMHGVGYMEGYLTCDSIYTYYGNFASTMAETLDDGSKGFSTVTLKWLVENWDWMDKLSNKEYKIPSAFNTDNLSFESGDKQKFWVHVRGIVQQVRGLLAGYLDCKYPLMDDMSAEERLLRANASWAMRNVDLTNMDNPSILQLIIVSSNGDLYQVMSLHEKIRHKTGAYKDEYDKTVAESKKNGNDGNPMHYEVSDKGNTTLSDDKINDHVTVESVKEISTSSLLPDHCSALIKVLPDHSDVLFAHTTWDSYTNAAPRIFKRYHLRSPTGVTELHFSSSPGMMSSVDDFYTLSTASRKSSSSNDHRAGSLAVIETSIDVFKDDVLKTIVPESLMSWVRVRVANEISANGRDWATIYQRYFSGTYVNQWMVLDLARFDASAKTRSDAIQDGFLTVLEELPGLVVWEDMSPILRDTSYWASYNLPYFDAISERSGASDRCAANQIECHDYAPRAQQLKRLQAHINNMEDMKYAISYNDYKDDPTSEGDSCRAVACREDLESNTLERNAFGAIDAKVSSVNAAYKNIAARLDHVPEGGLSSEPRIVHSIRLGPTQTIGNQKLPFCWNKLNVSHATLAGLVFVDHPTCFDSDWQDMPPADATDGWLVR